MEKRILVVDDEAPIAEMMARALTKAGYNVETASSAKEALELISLNKYFVFFLDLNIPQMNGIELCRLIRKDNPLSIAYAISGYTTAFREFDYQEAGFADYFIKPIKLQRLLSAAEDAFRKKAN
jgi:DNA-binding NtrC family response regulator